MHTLLLWSKLHHVIERVIFVSPLWSAGKLVVEFKEIADIDWALHIFGALLFSFML
jgi:hypothetical protein